MNFKGHIYSSGSYEQYKHTHMIYDTCHKHVNYSSHKWLFLKIIFDTNNGIIMVSSNTCHSIGTTYSYSHHKQTQKQILHIYLLHCQMECDQTMIQRHVHAVICIYMYVHCASLKFYII